MLMKNRRIGFIFAGQGSQKLGMGRDLYDNHDDIKTFYDQIDLDFDIKEVCFNGPIEKLNDTRYTQSAILLTSMAISRVLKNYNIVPEMVAGLSLGEYSALTYSGVLSVKDALKVVSKRGQIMSDALLNQSTSMMAVLGLDVDVIKDICNQVTSFGVCEIANINCPGQVVITGHNTALEEAAKRCIANHARRIIPLNVSGAFHSSLLKEAAASLRLVLEPIEFNKPTIRVVFNKTGKVETENIKQLLVEQIQSTVLFQDSLEHMIDSGINCFIEIGPGSTLSGFVKKIDTSVEVFSVENQASLSKLLEVIL
jgi:[acyl-carrier-protein] S-malonyltransferase